MNIQGLIFSIVFFGFCFGSMLGVAAMRSWDKMKGAGSKQ